MELLCIGLDGDVAANATRNRAAEAGAIEAAVEAMRSCPQKELVHAWACNFLLLMTFPRHSNFPQVNTSALARTQRILAANPVALLESAHASFPQNRMLARDAPNLLEVLRLTAAAP